jgi:hypothetical protein
MTVKAMKAGAVEILTKSVRAQTCSMRGATRWNAMGCGGTRPRNRRTLRPASTR